MRIRLFRPSLISAGLFLLLAGCGKNEQSSSSKGSSTEAQTLLYEARIAVVDLEKEIAKDTARLQAQFEILNKKRNALTGQDASAVATFKGEAAAYTAEKNGLDELKTRLVQAQGTVQKLSGPVSTAAASTSVATGPAASSPAADSGLAPQRPTPAQGTAIVYMKRLSPASIMVRTYLAGRGIQFQELDIESSESARKQWESYRIDVVPIVVTHGKVIEGYSKEKMDAAFPKEEDPSAF